MKRLILPFTALFLSLTLVSCGSSWGDCTDNCGGGGNFDSNLVGTWTITGSTGGVDSTSPNGTVLVIGSGGSYTTTYASPCLGESDGGTLLTIGGSMTYTTTSSTAGTCADPVADTDTFGYTISGTTLVLLGSGWSITYTIS